MRTFRMGWFSVFGAIMGFLTLVALPLCLLALLDTRNWHDTKETLAIIFGAATLFEAVFTTVIVAVNPVRIGREAVQATDFWGSRFSLRWEEIKQVERRRFLGLPYALLTGRESNRALWLPLFVAGRAEFREALTAFAPSEHPLRQM